MKRLLPHVVHFISCSYIDSTHTHKYFFASLIRYGQKWTWKLIDDSIRANLRLDEDVRNTPNVFLNDQAFDRGYVRHYHGDRDFYDLVPSRKRWNFR